MNSKRNIRQIDFLGKEGQELIKKAYIAVVGIGGLGSHVGQQLSYLGAGHLVFIDLDEVEEHNLNRLIGAYPDDIGAKKTVIASRLAKQINPSVKIKTVSKDLRTTEAFSEIKKANYVFGCVDNDGARLVLNELCCAFQIPYIDLATEVSIEEPIFYGGRIFVNSDKNGCLYCYGEIDPEQAGLDLSSPEARKDREDIYGIPSNNLGTTGPSVVSLNGVVASLAVTEFMVMATGLRQPNRFISYYGHKNQGFAGLRQNPQQSDCYYCKTVRGQRRKANVERYIK